MELKSYPYFEDVQVLKYINDPKADLGDKGQYSGDAKGLKGLSKLYWASNKLSLRNWLELEPTNGMLRPRRIH